MDFFNILLDLQPGGFLLLSQLMTPGIRTIVIAVAFFFSAAAFAAQGEPLFKLYCSKCHGPVGAGGAAPALNKEGLLTTVEESYIFNTVKFGRLLGCPSLDKKISEKKMRSIASYIKAWRKKPMLDAPGHRIEPGITERGRQNFALCGGCHGLEGEGAMGPALLDPGFLKSISDTELRRTIMHGRPGTPMKGYLKDKGGLSVMTPEEIDEVISYMRYRQKGLK